MASTSYEYQYKIYLDYICNNKVTEIPSSSIIMCLIKYDYASKETFTPIVFLKLKLKSEIFNAMQKNKQNAKVAFRITKVRKNSTVELDYIYRQMDYFFSTDDVDNEVIQGQSGNKKSNDESYVDVNIGLIDTDAIDANRICTNMVFKDTNTETIVSSFMNFKLVKEKFDYSKPFNQFILPPIVGVPKMIRYMNDEYPFYTTDYIYFYSFNQAYLLSKKGTEIDLKDGSFSTVNIDVTSQANSQEESNLTGMVIDNVSKMYNIQVNSNEFNFSSNKTLDYLFNDIRAIDIDGKITSTKLNSNKNTSSKTVYKRYNYYAKEKLDTYCNDIGSSKISVSITKGGLDNSILIPCRRYNINLPGQYEIESGKYFLEQKIETYKNNSDNFISSTALIFRKV